MCATLVTAVRFQIYEEEYVTTEPAIISIENEQCCTVTTAHAVSVSQCMHSKNKCVRSEYTYAYRLAPLMTSDNHWSVHLNLGLLGLLVINRQVVLSHNYFGFHLSRWKGTSVSDEQEPTHVLMQLKYSESKLYAFFVFMHVARNQLRWWHIISSVNSFK